jgi:hypothetical protein
MTNMQTAAQVAAQLTSLTNCKDNEAILETFNFFFDEISEKLGSDKVVINNTQISSGVSSPRNVTVIKSQEELQSKLASYTTNPEAALSAAMLQSARPIKKNRPKAHPPKKSTLEF